MHRLGHFDASRLDTDGCELEFLSVTCTRDEEHAYSVTADSVPISQVEGVDMEIRVESEKMTYGEVGLGDHKVLAKGSVGS